MANNLASEDSFDKIQKTLLTLKKRMQIDFKLSILREIGTKRLVQKPVPLI